MGRTVTILGSKRDCELGLVFLRNWGKASGSAPATVLRLWLCHLSSPVASVQGQLQTPRKTLWPSCKPVQVWENARGLQRARQMEYLHLRPRKCWLVWREAFLYIRGNCPHTPECEKEIQEPGFIGSLWLNYWLIQPKLSGDSRSPGGKGILTSPITSFL